MKHFMIDIETLALRIDSVVLSIGCVEFNKDGLLPNRSFSANLEPREQMENRRTVDLRTVEWWMDFGDRYPKHDRIPVITALTGLNEFFGTEPFFIWAKPPTFDISILTNLFDMYNVHIPWDRRRIRDVYTISDLLDAETIDEINDLNWATAHNAVHDCETQVKLVTTAWRAHGN